MAKNKPSVEFQPDGEMEQKSNQKVCFRVNGKIYPDLGAAFNASAPSDKSGVSVLAPIYFGTLVSDDKGHEFFFVHRVITQAYIDWPTMPVENA